MNNLLGQADTLFEAAIVHIPDVPWSLRKFICLLISHSKKAKLFSFI